MRINPISHGVVMKALLGGPFNTIQGSTRNTTFVQEAIDSVWVPYQITGMPELRGSTTSDGFLDNYLGNNGSAKKPANPDNIVFSEKLRTLFIAEDTNLRMNNLVWAYNVDTLVTSIILSNPFGAESSAIGIYDDINGFSYCTTSFQHMGEDIFPTANAYFGENAIIQALTDRWGSNYKNISSIGYISSLPYLMADSKQLSVVAKDLKLTDSSASEFVLDGNLLKSIRDSSGTFSVGNGNMTVKSTGSIAAKDLNLTDSSGTVYVLTGDLIKKLISL
jgi:hypothetical protein